ncbi:MAG: hypothetical protein RJQ09_20985 [Cyclobacteriaceae bacterium]
MDSSEESPFRLTEIEKAKNLNQPGRNRFYGVRSNDLSPQNDALGQRSQPQDDIDFKSIKPKNTSMKSLLIIVGILISQLATAEDKFETTMLANIDALYNAGTIENLQNAANKFERIANAETDQWLPGYYAALAYSWMASREEDPTQKDAWLDQATKMLENALARTEPNVETYVMQGFIYTLRLTVDPASRGQIYSQKSYAEYGKAVKMDSENPRALFFMGNMEYGTAQFFKADTSGACEKMAQSLELFDKFTPESAIHPSWGLSFAQKTVENCK